MAKLLLLGLHVGRCVGSDDAIRLNPPRPPNRLQLADPRGARGALDEQTAVLQQRIVELEARVERERRARRGRGGRGGGRALRARAT